MAKTKPDFKFIASHFRYSRRQRIGVLILISVILVLQGMIHFLDFAPGEKPDPFTEEVMALQHTMDSLEGLRKKDLKPSIYPFNPNFLSDFRAYRLGMRVEQIDRLFAFRGQGKFIHSAEEFKQVTGVEDSLLRKIAPFFRFPKRYRPPSKTKAKTPSVKSPHSGAGLNSVSAEDLQHLPGINQKMARRIVSYRKLIKGYSLNDQLYEVYDLERTTADRILSAFPIRDVPNIEKLDINRAEFREVLKLPYIDYELTKSIFAYRDRVIRISDMEELKKIDSFPLDKFDRIALYLQAE